MASLIRPSEEIKSRKEFSSLCNHRKLYRIVEVGVDRGDFTYQFLIGWDGRHTPFSNYYCIDPYLPYPEMPWNRSGDKIMAMIKLSPFSHCVRFIEMSSDEFLSAIDKGIGPQYPLSFDFVYIDARHEKDSTTKDILLWWPRISKKGILAGHDFDPGHPGVVKSVTEFVEKNSLVMRYTQDIPNSWYIYKTEPTDLSNKGAQC